jgi:D-tyrosyl-tRNA(Tyr) deacylase
MVLLIRRTISIAIRVFDDPESGSMWKHSVKDIAGEILCISQFTLLANTRQGNKPDFHRAMVRARSIRARFG